MTFGLNGTYTFDWFGLGSQEGLTLERPVFRAISRGIAIIFGPNNCGKSRILQLLCSAELCAEVPWDLVERAADTDSVGILRKRLEKQGVNLLYSFGSKASFELSKLADPLVDQEISRLKDVGPQLTDLRNLLNVQKPEAPVPQRVYLAADRFLRTWAELNAQQVDVTSREGITKTFAQDQNHVEPLRRARFDRVRDAFHRIAGVKIFVRQENAWNLFIDDGVGERSLDQCGDGLRDLLGLLYLVEYHKDKWLFIDEPGVRLHPRAQRALLSYLIEEASARPIWIATHDGVFIGASDVDARYSVSRLNGTTTVQELPTYQAAREAFASLGWHAADAMLSDTIVYCEGPSDVAVFRYILEQPGIPSFKGVEVVALGGERLWDKNAQALKSVLDTVKGVAAHAKFAAVIDQGAHSAAKYDGLRKILLEHGVELGVLSKGELENYWLLDEGFVGRLLARVHAKEVEAPELERPTASEVIGRLWELYPHAANRPKGSKVIQDLADTYNLRSDKIMWAITAAELMRDGDGPIARQALAEDLQMALSAATSP